MNKRTQKRQYEQERAVYKGAFQQIPTIEPRSPCHNPVEIDKSKRNKHIKGNKSNNDKSKTIQTDADEQQYKQNKSNMNADEAKQRRRPAIQTAQVNLNQPTLLPHRPQPQPEPRSPRHYPGWNWKAEKKETNIQRETKITMTSQRQCKHGRRRRQTAQTNISTNKTSQT